MKLNNILTLDECNEFINYFDSHDTKKDGQVIGSDIIHYSEITMNLSYKLKDILESKLSYKLKPTQSWIRKYYKGNELRKHRDNQAECAISILLNQSDSELNPLYIYHQESPTEIILDIGDGYFFEGGTVWHSRPPIKSEYLYGLFLGYDKITNISII